MEKKIEGIVDAIQDGAYSAVLKERLHECESRKAELTKRLATVPAKIPDIHPNVAGVYRRKVARLAKALSKPEERDAAAAAIRGLIDGIVLTPGDKRGELQVTLRGEFGKIPGVDGKRSRKGKDRHAHLGNVGLGGCGGTQQGRIFDLAGAPVGSNPGRALAETDICL